MSAVLAMGACGRPSAAPSEPLPPASTAASSSPVVRSASPSGPDAAVISTVGAAAKPAIAAPASCTTDRDCDWDDPCVPKSCGAASSSSVASGKRCDSADAPGQCRCLGGGCMLVRPEAEREPSPVTCQSDSECAFDAANGRCVNGTASALPGPGIACVCDTLNKRCLQTHQGEVPCKTFRDCSWHHVSGRVTTVAPSWFIPRPMPRPVRPCKDGSVDSKCEAGKCTLEAWRC